MKVSGYGDILKFCKSVGIPEDKFKSELGRILRQPTIPSDPMAYMKSSIEAFHAPLLDWQIEMIEREEEEALENLQGLA